MQRGKVMNVPQSRGQRLHPLLPCGILDGSWTLRASVLSSIKPPSLRVMRGLRETQSVPRTQHSTQHSVQAQ